MWLRGNALRAMWLKGNGLQPGAGGDVNEIEVETEIESTSGSAAGEPAFLEADSWQLEAPTRTHVPRPQDTGPKGPISSRLKAQGSRLHPFARAQTHKRHR